jgi:ribonuclease-3
MPEQFGSEADGMDLEGLQQKLGHVFRDRDLLIAALTHRSYAHESQKPCTDNESLEFLGDAVLSFDVCDRLFRRFPGLDEGRLSKHKHLLVRASTLADCARDLELGRHVRLGRGERKSGSPNERILANVFEAVVAAVHVDGGLDAVRQLLDRVLDPRLDGLDADNPVTDWKSLLQERTQSLALGTPVYRTVDEIGPDHQRVFNVVVLVGERELATGTGCTKRSAHQVAARRALEQLNAEA